MLNAGKILLDMGTAFKALYNGNGKLAGTYTYSGGNWTKTA